MLSPSTALSCGRERPGQPVRFELTEPTRDAVDDYIKSTGKKPGDFLFSGRHGDASISTRQYARLVSAWIAKIGLDPKFFGTHSLRRTKATLIYWRTGNLRAVQLLLGRRKIESTLDISGSKSTTRWQLRSRSTFDEPEAYGDRAKAKQSCRRFKAVGASPQSHLGSVQSRKAAERLRNSHFAARQKRTFAHAGRLDLKVRLGYKPGPAGIDFLE